MIEGKNALKRSQNGDASLYLYSARFKNIQGFKEFSVDFNAASLNSLKSTLLLGDNSAGKTSFLRALALGMCDVAGAASFLETFKGTFIHYGSQDASIALDFHLKGKGKYRILTEIQRTGHFENVKQNYYQIKDDKTTFLLEPELFPWKNLFACGYGAGRGLGESGSTHSAYRLRDAVNTLFKYDQPLQHPELSLRRIIMSAQPEQTEQQKTQLENQTLVRFKTLIREIFMFNEQQQIALTEKGIEIIDGSKRSLLLEHGDGYRNTAAWVLDLVTWNMLAGRELLPEKISGIVLIDEIEQHLHPKWQRFIVQLLMKQFPRLQFIFTTHSPLCAAGTADLGKEKIQLFHFTSQQQAPEEIDISNIRGLKADQVLTSEAFGLPTTRNPNVAEKLDEFGKLYLKEQRNKEEESQFQKLKTFLDENLQEDAEEASTRALQKKLKDLLADLEMLSSGDTRTS